MANKITEEDLLQRHPKKFQREFSTMDPVIKSCITIVTEYKEYIFTARPLTGPYDFEAIKFKYTIPARYPFDPIRVKYLPLHPLFHPGIIDANGSLILHFYHDHSPMHGLEYVSTVLLDFLTEISFDDYINREAKNIVKLHGMDQWYKIIWSRKPVQAKWQTNPKYKGFVSLGEQLWTMTLKQDCFKNVTFSFDEK